MAPINYHHCTSITKINNTQGCRQPRAVTGGQEFYFPYFSSNRNQFFLFFLKLCSFSPSFWSSKWANRPSGKALATPLIMLLNEVEIRWWNINSSAFAQDLLFLKNMWIYCRKQTQDKDRLSYTGMRQAFNVFGPLLMEPHFHKCGKFDSWNWYMNCISIRCIFCYFYMHPANKIDVNYQSWDTVVLLSGKSH